MLPADHRLTAAADFRDALRRGRRASGRLLVLSVRPPEPATGPAVAATRVGLVVSRRVGNAVVRNRVKRRLRHLTASRLGTWPPGCDVVVRALPAAATATSDDLGAELDATMARASSPSPRSAARRDRS